MRQTMSDMALNGDFFQTFSIDEGNKAMLLKFS